MSPVKRILVANGVNLDLLGTREPDVYGRSSLADVAKQLEAEVDSKSVTLTFFQTNDEAALLDKIGEKWDGIVLNPGAWTHTSLALADRLKGLGVPYVEVHISNVYGREEFRKHSYTAASAIGVVSGFGIESYRIGLLGLITRLDI